MVVAAFNIYPMDESLSVFHFYVTINNVVEDLNRHFLPKKTYRWAKKRMKRCSTSLIIRETQIQSTMRYYLIPVRMAVIKNTTNNKSW